ncbi:hypothetical protein EJD97_019059 [Solanum chilense]|uniref:Uncharacterized protein n=2 Tax=Solanum subgen. Lycopersicon TaxID=49274 RepID=A0A3Q7HRN8_SOLLC|nr:hypothetical protein EJD97_019059 [Solanum chilense]
MKTMKAMIIVFFFLVLFVCSNFGDSSFEDSKVKGHFDVVNEDKIVKSPLGTMQNRRLFPRLCNWWCFPICQC